MDRQAFAHQMETGFASLGEWQEGWEPVGADPRVLLPPERLERHRRTGRAAAGQLPASIIPATPRRCSNRPIRSRMLAYTMAMQINPNNHALDSSQATSQMEKEVVADLARMFGYGETFLGHLTSSGTIANLEALWVARSLHPGKAIAASDQAHYTHGRMAEVIGLPFVGRPERRARPHGSRRA